MRHATAGIAALLIAAGHAAAADGFAWTGQGIVNRPDSTFDAVPTVACDPAGRLYAVWATMDSGSRTSWARWADSGWTAEEPLATAPPGVVAQVGHRLAFDQRGVGWLVWCYQNADNSSDIACSRLLSSGWTPAQRVNAPDSTDLDWSPYVAVGAGRIWCAWYGGPDAMSPYVVYASRWDDSAGCWGPETQVSPQNNAQNWFCDVAVDSLGTPHVVWLATLLYAVYYSRFDGTAWTPPQLVNDTSLVKAASWGAPRVVCDRNDRLHVSFTGVADGADSRDIFYTNNDGTGWSPCQMVTYDSSYSEWYSAVAADRPDDVWISYDRQGEGADQFRVYAQHYDGAKWSAPERLDNDSAYRDAVTAICTDSDGLPIVVWEGTSYARTNSDIYYNRCVRAPAVAEVGDDVAQTRWLSGHTFCGRDGIALTLNLNVASRVSVALLDLAGRCRASQDAALARAGPNRVRMRAQVPCGVYFVCVRAGTLTEVHKVLIVDSD